MSFRLEQLQNGSDYCTNSVLIYAFGFTDGGENNLSYTARS